MTQNRIIPKDLLGSNSKLEEEEKLEICEILSGKRRKRLDNIRKSFFYPKARVRVRLATIDINKGVTLLKLIEVLAKNLYSQ